MQLPISIRVQSGDKYHASDQSREIFTLKKYIYINLGLICKRGKENSKEYRNDRSSEPLLHLEVNRESTGKKRRGLLKDIYFIGEVVSETHWIVEKLSEIP